MSHDPTPGDAPLAGDASDEELLRAIRRAEAKTELPGDAKMQELAARLGPMMATRTTGAVAWRWLGAVAMAGVLVSGTFIYRSHRESHSAGTDAQLSSTPQPTAASPGVAHDEETSPAVRDEGRAPAPSVAAPVISVDSLPSTTVPARARITAPDTSCSGEIELVDRADAALRSGDARGALDHARQHAERCPNGVYVQERERIAIEALARLGRTSELRARAVQFEKRFPSSPHVRRVRSLAEGERE